MNKSTNVSSTETKSNEWRTFLFTAAVVSPLLVLAAVGGYGFIVWMLQVFVFGPPGANGPLGG